MYSSELPLRPGSIYTDSTGPPQPEKASELGGQLGAEPLLAGSSNAAAPASKEQAPASIIQEGLGLSSPGAEGRRHFLPGAVIHSLAAFLCISTALDAYNGTLFCWHPIMISLGFAGLLSEGILMAVDFRNVEGARRVEAIQLHACVQASAVASIAIGFWSIWRNKVLHGKQHFTTYHGKLGLLASVSSLLVAAFGAVAFRKLGILDHMPVAWQGRTKAVHRWSGPVVLLLALINLFIGYGTVAAGPRDLLHVLQRLALVGLGIAEAVVLWGERATCKLGWSESEKSV